MDQQEHDAPDPAAILQQGLGGMADVARTVLSAAREAATAGIEAGRDALAEAGAGAAAEAAVSPSADPVVEDAAVAFDDDSAPTAAAEAVVTASSDTGAISELADPPPTPMLDAGDQPAGELPSGESAPAGVVGDDDAVGTSMPPLGDTTS